MHLRYGENFKASQETQNYRGKNKHFLKNWESKQRQKEILKWKVEKIFLAQITDQSAICNIKNLQRVKDNILGKVKKPIIMQFKETEI